MTRSYLSVAIDHGTTNSAIAVMGSDGPRAVRPDGNQAIMPSAIYVSKYGRTLVGSPAYRAMLTQPTGEGMGYTGYKIRIGQDDRYAFDEAKKVMTAPQLGGLVMSELLKAAREETGEEIRGAVITVPAKFELSACEGTREAARLAGLKSYPLLQEPIAAALAYGFTSEDQRAQWIVFDLGGGTLDVSLVIVRDGQMVVPEAGHAGDNRLGGSKFDRELMDHVLGKLKIEYKLEGFSEKNPKYRGAWGRLMLAVEQAKIDLSRRDEATVVVEGELCKDEGGQRVKVDVPVTRQAYERMIAPDVEKSVHLCQNLLNANRLRAEEVNGLILVGGPTHTPYIRQVLGQRLGIPLYKDIDPMTAVVQGAAIYATTVPYENGDGESVGGAEVKPDSTVDVHLEYERSSRLPHYTLVGKVETSQPEAGELTVEIQRTDGQWTSGRLPVDGGIFTAELQLVVRKTPQLSRFRTTVLDAQGNLLAEVEEPEIWYPFPQGKIRLANSLRVALAGNRTDVLIKAGADLPARGQGTFVTTKELRKNSPEDLLKVPILETVTHLLGGEGERADCNVRVGELRIEGSDERVSRDLPAGAELELTIHQDESRQLQVMAYVPLLDEEFETTFQPEPFGVTVEEAKERFASEKERLQAIRSVEESHPIPAVGEHLKKIDELGVVAEVEKELDRASEGERDAAYRVWTRTLELSGALEQIWQEQTPARVSQMLERIKEGAKESDQEQLHKIEADLEECKGGQGGGGRMRQIESELDELDVQIRKRPFFELGLSTSALAGIRVSSEQHRVHSDAVDLLEELMAKGAPDVLTTQDLERIKEAQRRLVEAYPDLSQRITDFLAKLPAGTSAEDAYGSTLKRAAE